MKRLYLLRHAKAVASAPEDRQRVLSEAGHAQALALGDVMLEKGYTPQAVFCSPALRTKETYEDIAACIGSAEYIDDREKLYHASPGDLLTLLQAQQEHISSTLIVNHNPSIHQLAFMLTGEAPKDVFQELAVVYKPCTLTVLDCPIERWSALMPGQNRLVALIPPLV